MSAVLKGSIIKGIQHYRLSPSICRPLARLQSTTSTAGSSPAQQQSITKEEAQSRAKAILEMFPGDSPFKKSAYATVAGGIGAFLISKGIYVVNEETLVLVAFLIMSRFAYVKLSQPISEFFEGYINEMKAKLKSAGMEEVSGLERQIVALEEYRDNAVVVESYYNTRNENIVLEAELAEAQQMSAYFADIKARLDERLRFETERLAEEKRAKAEALLKGILEELKKPKVQESILKKCLVDLGNVKVKPGIQANL